MMYITCHSVLMTILFVIVHSSTHRCFPYNSIHDGVIKTNTTFRRIIFSTLLECAAECLQSSMCKSFNFDLGTRTCYLNTNLGVDGNVVPNNGFKSADINEWMKNLTGPCAEVTCSDGTYCFVNRLRATCKQETKSCGQSPVVKNSHMEYNNSFAGASVKYTCKKDFQQCHEKTTSRCLSNGLWESVTALCSQSVWHNSGTPFNAEIPCGDTDKLLVIIQGTPLQRTVFFINVVGRGDVVFHISARFNDHAAIRKIITNYQIKNKGWGVERRHNKFPFFVGRKFRLGIHLLEGFNTVTVNGKVILRQRRDMVGRKVDHIKICGDILLHEVELQTNL